MKMISLWMIVILVIALSGCEYILTEPTTTCEPPNKIVKDIYGNEVCVTPESDEFSLPEDEPGESPIEIPEITGDVIDDTVIDEEPVVEEPSVVSGLPRKEVTEGELVDFPNLQATDPDGDEITYTFEDPLDEDGEWQTEVGDAGEFITTITASDGENEVSQKILIVVLSSNNAPVISGLKDLIVVEEGDTITLDPVITDEEGDEVTVYYTGFMDSTEYKTGFDDAGEYKVKITATDGISETEMIIDIVIMDVNRAPIIETLDDIQVEVGDEIELVPEVFDADGDDVEFTFGTPFDEDGLWTPEEGDSGEYEVTVVASDGKAEDTETFKLTVGTPNLPPVFETLEDIIVDEGDLIEIDPSADDPEGESIVFTISGWLTEFVYQTTFEDAGTYDVEITATDGENVVKQEVTIQVIDKNRAPQWDPGSFN